MAAKDEKGIALALFAKSDGKSRLRKGLAERMVEVQGVSELEAEAAAGVVATKFTRLSTKALLKRLAPVGLQSHFLFYLGDASFFEDILREDDSGGGGSEGGAWAKAWTLVPAGKGGLGDVLSRAVTKIESDSGDRPIGIGLLGSDDPLLDVGPAIDAYRASLTLASPAKAVVVPAEDGGYVFLIIPMAVGRRTKELFNDVEWSTQRTCASQVAAIRKQGHDAEVLGGVHVHRDVDTLSDLKKLAKELRRDARGEYELVELRDYLAGALRGL